MPHAGAIGGVECAGAEGNGVRYGNACIRWPAVGPASEVIGRSVRSCSVAVVGSLVGELDNAQPLRELPGQAGVLVPIPEAPAAGLALVVADAIAEKEPTTAADSPSPFYRVVE